MRKICLMKTESQQHQTASSATASLRSLLRPRVAPHLARPSQKSQHLSFFLPEQIPEITRLHRLCLLARVRLQPPTQIWTTPRSQSIPPRRVPQKSKFFTHSIHPHQSIGILRRQGPHTATRTIRTACAGCSSFHKYCDRPDTVAEGLYTISAPFNPSTRAPSGKCLS